MNKKELIDFLSDAMKLVGNSFGIDKGHRIRVVRSISIAINLIEKEISESAIEIIQEVNS